MLFEVGDEVRVRQPTNLFHSELGKVVSIDHVKLTYKVVFHRGNSDVYTCFDLILVKRQEETSMKFKVGDKVKVSGSWRGDSGKVGTISRTDWGVTYKYKVEFEDADPESFKEEELELVKEEEKEMKFKVGDKVKIDEAVSNYYGRCGIVTDNQRVGRYSHKVIFEDGDWSVFTEKDLIVLSTEEEKVMKFKVGDKVKVKDSWFGRDGQVGVVFRTDNYEPFNYGVKFDTEGDNGRRYENFKEDSLELAKQSFTKSDLKTGMGVVLRDGSKGHVLVDTGCVDVIRFLENGNYSCLNDFSDDLTSNFKQQHDIAEVYFTEYQFKLFTEGVFEHDCVFKREEPKSEPKPEPEPTKMTMKEINEHFGKPIEIVE